jgi:hypothetical protein
MSSLSPARFTAVAVLVLAASAGCGSTSANTGTPPTTTPTVTATDSGAQAIGSNPSGTPTSKGTTTKTSAPSSGNTSEDCISYNPNNVAMHYEAGIFTIDDGTKQVMRLHGDPSGNTGQKGLALAQRYSKHCFLGRGNTREEKYSFVFDYWLNPSGKTPAIADQDNDCSDYNRNNLTVEDMGDNNGWRVKDHDHVLQLFDNGNDARSGKTILVKYSKICFIGDSDDDQDVVSYLL